MPTSIHLSPRVNQFIGGALLVFCAAAGRADDTAPRLWLEAGRRVDQLRFNIAGDASGANPNILSELTWSDITVDQLGWGGQFFTGDKFFFRLEGAWGRIVDGRNQDSDYAGDNRTLEFSRSNNQAGHGRTVDASLAVGWRWQSATKRAALSPLAGYAYDEQELHMTDGVQTVNLVTSFLGPFDGLNSRYETRWRGPWLGLEGSALLNDFLRVAGGVDVHWPSYHAAADWNLRDDFQHPKSFEHEAGGRGRGFKIGLQFLLSRRLSLALNYQQRNWRASGGTDRVFFSDGTVGGTKLNEVEWKSRATSLALTFHFRGPETSAPVEPETPGDARDK